MSVLATASVRVLAAASVRPCTNVVEMRVLAIGKVRASVSGVAMAAAYTVR